METFSFLRILFSESLEWESDECDGWFEYRIFGYIQFFDRVRMGGCEKVLRTPEGFKYTLVE